METYKETVNDYLNQHKNQMLTLRTISKKTKLKRTIVRKILYKQYSEQVIKSNFLKRPYWKIK